MEINIHPVTIESYTGGQKVLWDWTVAHNGKNLSGMEESEFSAKIYATIAVLRFFFTRV